MARDQIELYCDGSAIMAKKPGGYGWVIILNGKKYSEGYGYIRRADNNDAELEAALQGLMEVYKLFLEITLNPIHLKIFEKNPKLEGKTSQDLEYLTEARAMIDITICSDSQIVLDWASEKYFFKKEFKYQQFLKIKELVKIMNIQTKWIRGHSGHEHNERCDQLATLGRLRS